MKKSGIMLLVCAVLASVAVADTEPTVERGKALFNSTKLGKSGKTCASCHADLSALQDAAAYDENKLSEIINQCITKPLKGVALDLDSSDLKSLVLYLKSLAKAADK